jgi:hypothetical protein
MSNPQNDVRANSGQSEVDVSQCLRAELLLKYAGQYVGCNLDGARILASGIDEVAMEQRLVELGIDPSQVVGEYILPSEITSFLG